MNVNPITHLVDATRGLMHGNASVEEIAWVLAATAVLTIVFAPLVMRRYRDIA